MTIERQVNDAMQKYQMMNEGEKMRRRSEVGINTAKCIVTLADDIGFLKAIDSEEDFQPMIDAMSHLQKCADAHRPRMSPILNRQVQWTDAPTLRQP